MNTRKLALEALGAWRACLRWPGLRHAFKFRVSGLGFRDKGAEVYKPKSLGQLIAGSCFTPLPQKIVNPKTPPSFHPDHDG